MKIIHLSDLHIGKKVNGYSMIDDQKYILNDILSKIDDIKPNMIFIAGDVYDKNIPPIEAVELFDEFLTELVNRKLKVFIIYGNHDSAERISFANKILKNNDIYISPIFDGKIENIDLKCDCGDVSIYLLPFIKPITVKRYYEEEDIKDYNDAVKVVLEDLKIDEKKINIILAHQFLTGSEKSESEELAIGGLDNVDVSLFDKFDYVALGHLHKPQKLIRETVRYSGTPLKYSLSEINHKKSITEIEINSKDDIKIILHPLTPKRDVREIKGKYKDLIKEENYKNTNLDDYVSIVLTDKDEIINAGPVLNDIYKNVMKISYENQNKDLKDDFDGQHKVEQKSVLEIFDELFLQQNGENMTQEQKDYLIKIIDEVEGE